MADLVQLETRIAALEREVAELKTANVSSAPTSDWVEQISGSLKAYPEFDEVIASGHDARKTQGPPNNEQDAA